MMAVLAFIFGVIEAIVVVLLVYWATGGIREDTAIIRTEISALRAEVSAIREAQR